MNIPQWSSVRQVAFGRRSHQLLLAAYAVVWLMSVAMLIGPWLTDRSIESDPGRALATVTHVSRMRTTVDFQDAEGIFHSPPSGLLYPTGLGEGQKVWVIYKQSNPDLVKVEGREWTLAIIPATSVWVIATLIAAGSWWLMGRSRVNFGPVAEAPEPVAEAPGAE